jgi:hypothetical protein
MELEVLIKNLNEILEDLSKAWTDNPYVAPTKTAQKKLNEARKKEQAEKQQKRQELASKPKIIVKKPKNEGVEPPKPTTVKEAQPPKEDEEKKPKVKTYVPKTKSKAYISPDSSSVKTSNPGAYSARKEQERDVGIKAAKIRGEYKYGEKLPKPEIDQKADKIREEWKSSKTTSNIKAPNFSSKQNKELDEKADKIRNQFLASKKA